jgi:hypothetical protein
MMTVVDKYYHSAFPPSLSPNPKFGETEEAKAQRVEKEKAKGIDPGKKRTIGQWLRLIFDVIYVQFMADFGAPAFLVYK